VLKQAVKFAVPLALALTVAGPALAQSDSSDASSDAASSDASSDASANTDGGEVVISDEARRLFKLGVNLLEDPDAPRYEEAYRAFKAAYDDSPTPKILLNLGLCALKLERDGEAMWAFSIYLDKVPDIEADIRQQIETDLSTLRGGLVNLTLTVAPAGAVVLDQRQPVQGTPIVNRYGPLKEDTLEIGMRAGAHKLTIKLDGYEPQTIDLDMTPGEKIEREVTLVEATALAARTLPLGGADDAALPMGFWVGAGVTAALGVATAITGALALSNASDFDDKNTGADPAAAEEARDSTQTLNITTDVLLGATVASAVVTVVVLLTSSDGDDVSEAKRTFDLTPVVGRQAAGASLRVRF